MALDSSLLLPLLPRGLTLSAPTSTPLELSAPSSLSASSREVRPRPLPSSLMWERRRISKTWWPRPWRSSEGSMSCCEFASKGEASGEHRARRVLGNRLS